MASDFQKKKFLHFFRAFDSGNYITEGVFLTQLDRLGQIRGIDPDSENAKHTRADRLQWWQGLSAMIDTNGDGKLSQDEFVGFWLHIADTAKAEMGTDTTPTHDMLVGTAVSAFDLLDANDDGHITEKEYTDWFRSWSDYIASTDSHAAFKSLSDGGKTLNKEQLTEYVVEFFAGDNPDAPGTNLYGIIE